MKREPRTLQDAIKYFADPANVREYLIVRRWPDGIVRCPRCGSDTVKFQEKYDRFQCGKNHPLRQFTLKTGTIFEDSPISLDKWLLAMWMVVNCKNGVSSYEIARAIGVTQKSAWHMDHRIRFALHMETSEDKMGGEGSTVEADETYIGGPARNMHKNVKARKIQGRTGYAGKTAVFGLAEPLPPMTGAIGSAHVAINAEKSLMLWGLFQKLPIPGTPWSKIEREQWSETLQSILKMEYPEKLD
ncbi:MAG TPA: transposase [Terriglobia bacterium]|nr:transposase [Terriglobia bacterium]